jgi:3-methyladenine DNA glycosylase Tag
VHAFNSPSVNVMADDNHRQPPWVLFLSAKIQATVHNAREVLAVLDSYGSIRAYFASFPDAHTASADKWNRARGILSWQLILRSPEIRDALWIAALVARYSCER